MSENKATMGMIDSLSQNVQDMVTPQDFLELLYERAGMTLPQYFRCSDLPVKSVPSPLEDIRRAVKELAEIGNPPPPDRLVIRHHPDDTEAARALVAGMEPWRYHLAETEEVPKGDPEIFVIDHMPSGGRRLW
jgi:hypothetical protein